MLRGQFGTVERQRQRRLPAAVPNSTARSVKSVQSQASGCSTAVTPILDAQKCSLATPGNLTTAQGQRKRFKSINELPS